MTEYDFNDKVVLITGAVEFARKGIRVNAICPAFSHTPLVDKLVEEKGESRLANMAAHIPMQRLGQMDEIVQAMLWACSDDNGFMNGAVIPLDGGLSAC